MKEYKRNGKYRWHKIYSKIRLHLWDRRKNYSKNDKDVTCPICRKEEDAARVLCSQILLAPLLM